MKTITTMIIMLFVAQVSISQIKVVTPSEKEVLVGRVLGVTMSKTGDEYHLRYRDYKYIHLDDYKSFSFQDVDGTYDDLYAMIMRGFNDAPKERIVLELPNDIVYLQYIKVMGMPSLQIGHAVNMDPDVVGVTRFLTRKQVTKLFGKKKKRK